MKWKSGSDLLSNALSWCKPLIQAMQSNFKVGLGWPLQLSSSNPHLQLSHSLSGCLFQFLTMLTNIVWALGKGPPGEAITQTGQPSARALPLLRRNWLQIKGIRMTTATTGSEKISARKICVT